MLSLQGTRDSQQRSNDAEDVIEIVEHDPLWFVQFKTESNAIETVLEPLNLKPRIEHFGSTAIPNLPAKPIIDIFIILDDCPVWPQLIDPLLSLGYIYWAENPRRDRMFFVKGMPPYGERRSHHIHVRKSEDTIKELLFRNWLLDHPDDAAQYAKLKCELANRFRSNREAYTDSKADFIETILARAKSNVREA